MPVPAKRFRPPSRAKWRAWLKRNHATSSGVWLVFAKKHTGLPSLSYEDAVEEALCFGWIDSLVKSIDDRFHMQIFTPRKAKSAWSASNKIRVARLIKSGLMSEAGLAAVALARKSGTWNTHADVEALTIPPELQQALDANADARSNWPTYSESARRAFLYSLSNVKRPETRARRVRRIVDLVAQKVSMTELRKAAMAGTRIEVSGTPRPAARRTRSPRRSDAG